MWWSAENWHPQITIKSLPCSACHSLQCQQKGKASGPAAANQKMKTRSAVLAAVSEKYPFSSRSISWFSHKLSCVYMSASCTRPGVWDIVTFTSWWSWKALVSWLCAEQQKLEWRWLLCCTGPFLLGSASRDVLTAPEINQRTCSHQWSQQTKVTAEKKKLRSSETIRWNQPSKHECDALAPRSDSPRLRNLRGDRSFYTALRCWSNPPPAVCHSPPQPNGPGTCYTQHKIITLPQRLLFFWALCFTL